MSEIIFLGGGGHAKVVYEIARTDGRCSFADDNLSCAMSQTDCPRRGPLCDILCGEAKLPVDAYFVCTIGDNLLRSQVVKAVKHHYPQNSWWTVIDETARIAETADVGSGSMVLAGAILQADALVGEHCIINTAAVIEHDSRVADFVHVAPSAAICGHVRLGTGVFLGVGAKVIPQLTIGKFSVVGAGVVVLDHLPDSVTVTETWKKRGLPVLPAPGLLSPPWLPRKPFDALEIQALLSGSITRNHFANNGPTVQALEAYTRKLLGIRDSKALIAVSNATAGIHAVVDAWGGGQNFVTQAFTFPASAQGPLQNAQIVDMSTQTGGPDLDQIVGQPAGIVVTNVFGHLCKLPVYTEYARKTGCKLLFDNAATPWSLWETENACNFGNAAVISFHHTKPLGFGEGGMIIIDKEDEAMVRRIINFGYDVPKGDEVFLPTGNNYKMSDVSAAFILAHLKNHAIRSRQLHQQWYQQFEALLHMHLPQVQLLPHFADDEIPYVSCLVVLFPHAVPLQFFQQFKLYVRKYYKPLSLDRKKFPVSWDWYDRIICFPCHEEITDQDLKRYLEACRQYLSIVMVGEK